MYHFVWADQRVCHHGSLVWPNSITQGHYHYFIKVVSEFLFSLSHQGPARKPKLMEQRVTIFTQLIFT